MVAAPTLAQDEAEDDKSAIDQIIVTTMKREQAVQDVPVPVTVIGEEYLEVAAPQSLLDATGLAPNLFIGQQTAGPGIGAIYSRGQGYADVEKSQSPAFGVMVDGISFGTNTGQLTDLFDVQQIEINRGPQGLLYGKNTTAGVIDVKRTRPTEDMGVRAQFTYGSFDEYAAKAVLNSGRLFNDMAALKLGVQYREADGFYDNLYDGSTLGDIEQFLFTAGLAIDPTEDLSIYLLFDYMEDESETPPVQAENTLSLPPLPGANSLDAHDSLADIEQPTDYETTRISAEIIWDSPIGQLTSITGYISASDDVIQDFDSTCVSDLKGLGCNFNGNPRFPAPSLHTNRMQNYRQFSEEIRLASDFMDDRLHTIVGAYLYESKLNLQQFTDLNLQIIAPPLANIAVQDATLETSSSAVFANVEFDITEDLSVSVGARYISENFEISDVFSDAVRVAPLTPGAITNVAVSVNDDASFNEIITRLGIDWHVTDDNLVYLTRSEGFRSGGFSIRATLSELVAGQNNFTPGSTETFNTFLPEDVTTYELGSKNVFLDGDLVVNGNVFYQEVDNYQANFVVNTPGGPRGTNTYNNNFEEVSGWGVELEASLQVPGVEGLSINANFGYQDIEIDSAVIDARRVPVGLAGGGIPGSAAQGNIDFSTTPLSRTPDWSGSVSIVYDGELGNGMGIGGQITYRLIDDFTLANLGPLPDTEDGYDILDISAFVQVTENVRLGIFGRNLTDEEYRANALPSVGFQSFARPRTFFGQVTVEF
jgi:iron complex outermembrane receptor protein